MVYFKDPAEMANYFSFTAVTDADEIRLHKAWKMYEIRYKGDGWFGCVAEMLTATPHSKKLTIANTGKNDNFINYRTANGKVVPVSCERKTNGGRIETFDTEFSKAERMNGKYVIYTLDVCNAGTSYKRRYAPTVVIPRKLFIEKLREFNAIKAINRNGEFEAWAIQVTSKKLYNWLLDYPIVYDRTAVYCDDDFEGLF